MPGVLILDEVMQAAEQWRGQLRLKSVVSVKFTCPLKPGIDALAERINPVFLPRPLYKVDSLPRNAMGKLPREALSRLLEQLRNSP